MPLSEVEAQLLLRQRGQSLPSSWEMGIVYSLDTSAMTAVVLVAGKPETLPYGRSLVAFIAVGDRVAVQRSGTRGYISEAFPPLDDATPPLAVEDSADTGTTYFVAIDARTYQVGAWRTDSSIVAQGNLGDGQNTGVWFYGHSPGSALSGAAASVTGARIRLKRSSGGTVAPATVSIWMHTSEYRATGPVTLDFGPLDYDLSIGVPTWVDLPPAWGQAIVDSGGGIAINGAPYVAVEGLSSDPASGQLQLDWTR